MFFLTGSVKGMSPAEVANHRWVVETEGAGPNSDLGLSELLLWGSTPP